MVLLSKQALFDCIVGLQSIYDNQHVLGRTSVSFACTKGISLFVMFLSIHSSVQCGIYHQYNEVYLERLGITSVHWKILHTVVLPKGMWRDAISTLDGNYNNFWYYLHSIEYPPMC